MNTEKIYQVYEKKTLRGKRNAFRTVFLLPEISTRKNSKRKSSGFWVEATRLLRRIVLPYPVYITTEQANNSRGLTDISLEDKLFGTSEAQSKENKGLLRASASTNRNNAISVFTATAGLGIGLIFTLANVFAAGLPLAAILVGTIIAYAGYSAVRAIRKYKIESRLLKHFNKAKDHFNSRDKKVRRNEVMVYNLASRVNKLLMGNNQSNFDAKKIEDVIRESTSSLNIQDRGEKFIVFLLNLQDSFLSMVNRKGKDINSNQLTILIKDLENANIEKATEIYEINEKFKDLEIENTQMNVVIKQWIKSNINTESDLDYIDLLSKLSPHINNYNESKFEKFIDYLEEKNDREHPLTKFEIPLINTSLLKIKSQENIATIETTTLEKRINSKSCGVLKIRRLASGTFSF
jgi:xanthosine utilization system XapX-like protein